MNSKKSLIALAVASTLSTAPVLVSAAGFALIEQNASGMGNAFAGAAAVAEDASTIFFNPAGLTKLQGKQVVVAGHLIQLGIEFSNNGNSAPPLATGITTLGTNGGEAGDDIFVPNLYFSMPLGEKLTFGVGVNAPFGLVTEYDSDWIGRFQGIKSDLATLNVNPTLAYEISDAVSVGFGVSYQQFEAELTNKISGAAINPAFVGQEFNASLEADDTGFGWNAGVLIQASPMTRIGASYRSAIDYTLEGSVTVSDPTGALFAPASGAATADVTLPDMFSVSLMQKLGDKFDVLADITFTRWSEIQSIQINNPAGGTRDTLVLNFDDTYRYSIGLNYRFSDQLTGKVGLAMDESPVNDGNRTVRLPDNDRRWISIGGSYKLSDTGRIDFAFANLSTSDTVINQTRGIEAAFGRVAGSYDVGINIFSVQYAMSF